MNDIMTVNIDNLKLDWFIGIYEHEYEKPQPVSITIKLEVNKPNLDGSENYDDVVCYKTIVDKIKELSKQGHIKLVETLSNKIADICLQDQKTLNVEVTVKKLNAIDEVDSVGVKLIKNK